MWKDRYKRIRYSKRNIIAFFICLNSVIGVISIIAKALGYKNYTGVGIAIASIGVLIVIAISYITLEIRKNSNLVRHFIIANELFQAYIDEKGKEIEKDKIIFLPNVIHYQLNLLFDLEFR